MNKRVTQAVILAGGLGTRLKPFTNTKPKPMYPINNVPFIDYLIRQMKDFGMEEVLLLLGYLPEKIMDYLGDGSNYGLTINYDITPVDYDTGMRIKHAASQIADKFLLLYCDNYCPINYSKLFADFCNNEAKIQITAYSNRDNYTKSNLHITDNGLVTTYDKKRITPNLQGVDIGYALVDKSIISLIPEGNCNFEAEVYPQLVEQNKLFATVNEHRYYSIGSFKRIKLTEEFFKPKRVVFLDRDGTINKRPARACYIEKPEDFVWLPGAIEAINILKKNGFLVIIITNQPGIARGNLTEEMLHCIHEKMRADLLKERTEIDDIFYCPHNWDDGCFCRKPNPGMIFEAQKKYSLNLSECYLIGDDERDIAAGEAAGCICRMVDGKYTVLDVAKEIVSLEKKEKIHDYFKDTP